MQYDTKKTNEIKSYDEQYKNFQWEVPPTFNFGFDIVDKWAEDRTKLGLIYID